MGNVTYLPGKNTFCPDLLRTFFSLFSDGASVIVEYQEVWILHQKVSTAVIAFIQQREYRFRQTCAID